MNDEERTFKGRDSHLHIKTIENTHCDTCKCTNSDIVPGFSIETVPSAKHLYSTPENYISVFFICHNSFHAFPFFKLVKAILYLLN